MAFYRKYRPKVIDEIDNLYVRDRLKLLAGKKPADLPHAYLLTGPKGCGKTTTARIIARIFNCEKPVKGSPCGLCDLCRQIGEGRSTDVIEIDAASNRGIDEIRLIRERIGLAPASASYTVYIIDEVHMLTTEAFNALLKTLEEPPSHAVFILATTELDKVPATIISRCHHFQFLKAATGELVSAINRVSQAEKIQINQDALELLANLSEGSFRDAIKNLETLSLTGRKIDMVLVSELVSASSLADVESIIAGLLAGDFNGPLETVRRLAAGGKDLRILMVQLARRLTEMITTVARKTSSEQYLLEKLLLLSDEISRVFSASRYAPVPELPLFSAMISFVLKTKGNDIPVRQEPVEEVKPTPNENKLSESHEPYENISLQKLLECWPDVIAEVRRENHSLAGILRSARPKSIMDNTVVVEAFYQFHRDKMTETKSLAALSQAFKKLFGHKLAVEVVFGKKS